MLSVSLISVVLLSSNPLILQDSGWRFHIKQPVIELVQGEQNEANLQTALNFVRATGLNRNFQNMIVQTATRTQIFAAAAAGLGKEKTIEALKAGIEEAVGVYGDKWDRNLAATYLQFYEPEELMSLMEDPKGSPYLAKFTDNRDRVGNSMKEKSFELLKNATADVVTHVFETYSKSQE